MSDFRLYLQEELVRRCRVNPKYSLRAFAKKLQLEPSFLSKLLRGHRRLTPKKIKDLSQILGLDPVQTQGFLNHDIKDRHGEIASLKNGQAVEFRQMTLDSFKVISDWYHYAILELITVKGFKGDANWIAKTLHISPAEANAAVERLVRIEMLKILPNGKWINISGNNTTLGNEFTAVAFRKLQKQILEQALLALEDVPMERRSQTSMTMAIDSKKLPQAVKQITDFRRKLCEFLQTPEKGLDQVYQLSISIFPITDLENASNNRGKNDEN